MATRKLLPLFISNVINECDSSSSSSLSSSSSSDSEDEGLQALYLVQLINETCNEVTVRKKLENYVEIIVPGYTKYEFKEHFRIFPDTFEEVLSFIGPRLNATNSASGRKPIPANTQLFIALWYMATPDSYRTISTLSNEVKISSNENTVSSKSMQLSPSSASFDTENTTDYSDTSNDMFVSSNIPSEKSKTLKPILKTNKKQKHNDSEIQTALLDFIKEPIPHVDAIDGYLKTLGEALRRLPYRKRKLMEMKFLQMVLEAEEN
ncbi:hypothetical protein ALC57_03101 [Trachymyrmex cornetzi]|uniref:BESS domain-containing protein n=1 Tax=Trachymyrmex cornetzi TaxID=471704 RepID=A0A151JN74_9HYME|nr:hypothetical protein ALC57_03101 [Trachymyrmex cornetzi]